MLKTEIIVQKKNDINIVSIAGSIDETFGSKIVQIPIDSELVFTLEGLKAINSTGIREWVKLMQKVSKQKVSFLFCPKIFIDQLNMVQGFISEGSRIISFYVPYFSEDEDVEKSVLFTYGKEFDSTGVKPPQHVLSDTGKPMELDVVAAKYFKFISEMAKAK